MKKFGLVLLFVFGLGLAQAQTLLPIPPQSSSFGNTRGYWFQAPIDFTIVSIYVPTGVPGGYQSSQIIRLAATPPSYPANTNTYTNLFYAQNVNSVAPIACNVPVMNGDILMILGARSSSNATASCTNTNSYGAYSGTFYVSSVCGMPMNLTRAGFQSHICRGPAFDVWQEPAPNYYISRVELMYTCGILPVGLTGFAGMAHENTTKLQWQSSTEVNFDRYEIERASKSNLSLPISEAVQSEQITVQTSDGTVQTVAGSFMVNTDDWHNLNFENIGTVAGNGQANSETHYDFSDAAPIAGYNYYRLKRIDLDGSFEYSNVIEVLSGKSETQMEALWPNPTLGQSKLSVFSTETQNATVSIFDLQGKRLNTAKYVLSRGANELQLDLSDFASGSYFVNVAVSAGEKFSRKIVKQ